ncbi:hypothetical protein CsatB_018544 [Cannabis sativa]|uniref:Uncharacterized protein n=1 Tax=Cannabis sativa TaxID=3483 RepID=A0A803QWZ5_CANSA
MEIRSTECPICLGVFEDEANDVVECSHLHNRGGLGVDHIRNGQIVCSLCFENFSLNVFWS